VFKLLEEFSTKKEKHMSTKQMLKISKEVAQYMLLNDLASRFILTEAEAESGLRVLQRNQGSFKMKNNDCIEYHNRSWHIVRR